MMFRITAEQPYASKHQAEVMAARLFGLHISDPSSVRELYSYCDRNFYMKGWSLNEQEKKKENCDEYILKILNHDDSTHDCLVEAQCDAMLFLKGRGYECPTPILSVFNTSYVMCKIPRQISKGHVGLESDLAIDENQTDTTPLRDGCSSDVSHKLNDVRTERNLIDIGPEVYDGDEYCNEEFFLSAVRLLAFVTGKVMSEVPLTTELLYNVGKAVGKLDRDLKDFDFPRLNRPGFLWDLSRAGDVIEHFLEDVTDLNLYKEMIREICDGFQKEVAPRIQLLPKQIIHGDTNYSNIILDQQDQNKIKGFIDFGFLNHSCRVFELAILLMHTLNAELGFDRIRKAGLVFAGYHSVNPLSEAEIDLIYVLTASRFCQSLIGRSYDYTGNDHELVKELIKGWKNCEAFWNTPKVEVLKTWLQVSEELTNFNEKDV